MIRHQSDELVGEFRGRAWPDAIKARDDSEAPAGARMVGHFAVFNRMTEINSYFEGHFMEQIAPGAFAKTLRDNRSNIKVQFDHGYDSHIGSAPLGPIDVLREDKIGVWYEVPLLDTDYNRDRILPLLRGSTIDGEEYGSLLGASFRFQVVKEEIDEGPEPNESNPNGLPLRTIKELRLFEFGPVVFPAYPDATASARSASLTTHFRDLHSARAGSTTRVEDPTEPLDEHSEAISGRSIWAARTSLLAP